MIIEQIEDFDIRTTPKGGYEVYLNTSTHAVRVSQIGYRGEYGLLRARQEVSRRLALKESK